MPLTAQLEQKISNTEFWFSVGFLAPDFLSFSSKLLVTLY